MRKDKQNQGYQAKEEKLGSRREKEGQVLEACFQEKGTNLVFMTAQDTTSYKGLKIHYTRFWLHLRRHLLMVRKI